MKRSPHLSVISLFSYASRLRAKNHQSMQLFVLLLHRECLFYRNSRLKWIFKKKANSNDDGNCLNGRKTESQNVCAFLWVCRKKSHLSPSLMATRFVRKLVMSRNKPAKSWAECFEMTNLCGMICEQSNTSDRSTSLISWGWPVSGLGNHLNCAPLSAPLMRVNRDVYLLTLALVSTAFVAAG